MSTYMPQQVSPIIIKGGVKSSRSVKAIEIEANSTFQVTQEFQSQPNEWTESASEFVISYVESVVVGEMGTGQQYCQTSSMAHPLTYEFKDSDNKNIFVIREVAAGDGYGLQIAVALTDSYFLITDGSTGAGEAWSTSDFGSTEPVIEAVEVIDDTGVPVCRLTRANGEDIFLNLEPAG